MPLKPGLKIVPLSPRMEELAKLFSLRPGTVQLEPGSWQYAPAIEKYSEAYGNFQFEESDVIVMTMPKSGTTWSQEIVWTMRNNPALDPELAATPLNIRSPCLEIDFMIEHIEDRGTFKEMFEKEFPDFDQSFGMFLHVTTMADRPRTIKTHLSFPLLSDTALTKAKVVYTIRDPRDVCISYYHHSKIFTYENFTGTFDQYVDAFIEGAVWLGPYWSHVKEAWSRRNHPNLHINFFEQLKRDPKTELQKLNTFLKTKLSEEQIDKLVRHTSFQEMKKRNDHIVGDADAAIIMNFDVVKSDGGFFRQGKSGGWKDVLTQAQKDKFQVWIEKNCPDMEIMRNIDEAEDPNSKTNGVKETETV